MKKERDKLAHISIESSWDKTEQCTPRADATSKFFKKTKNTRVILFTHLLNVLDLLLYSCLVLVQPKKSRPDITEKVLTGT